MSPDERRRTGTCRILPLHGDHAKMDDTLATGLTPQERMEALWDLTLEYLAWTRPDDSEPRLQRSVCHLERRGR